MNKAPNKVSSDQSFLKRWSFGARKKIIGEAQGNDHMGVRNRSIPRYYMCTSEASQMQQGTCEMMVVFSTTKGQDKMVLG